MQIEVREIEPCKVKVQYQADPDQVASKRDEILAGFKKAPVPGQRPGRAAVQAIKIHYRNQINDALKRALAEDAFHNTIFEKQLKPHGQPQFTSLFLSEGKFNCEFDLYVRPQFELSNFKNLDIPKPHEPEDVAHVSERMMQELRVRYGQATPYSETDFIQSDDNVILNYEGYVDGDKLDNLSAEGEMLTVGKSDLNEFDQNLLGMTLNETREFTIKVPENGLPSIANKNVMFKVTLVMGSKVQPAPLDDTLAAKLNKTTFAELKAAVSEAAYAQVANKFKLSLNEAISKRLVTDNQFVVPDWMTLSEARYLVSSAKLNWDNLNDQDKAQYMQVALNNVKLSLILDKIREDEPEAQLTDQEVFEIIKRNLGANRPDLSVDELLQQMNKNGYLQVLFSRIRDEHTLDFVVKQVRVVE